MGIGEMKICRIENMQKWGLQYVEKGIGKTKNLRQNATSDGFKKTTYASVSIVLDVFFFFECLQINISYTHLSMLYLTGTSTNCFEFLI